MLTFFQQAHDIFSYEKNTNMCVFSQILWTVIGALSSIKGIDA